MEFAAKLLFRLVHITSGIVLAGNVFVDTIFGISHPQYALVVSISGVLLLTSGLVNLYFLRPQETMGTYKKRWMAMVHTKLLLWTFFLPWPEILFRRLGSEFPRKTCNQVLCVLIILLSSYSKQYRDWAVVQKLTKDR